MKRLVAVFILLSMLVPCISVRAEDTVIYENDFSDPSTISDFSQYRHAREIKNGALHCTSKVLDKSVTDSFSHILYNAKTPLTDYVAEVDYMNARTTGGIVFRADAALDKYFMECNQYETVVGNKAGDTNYDGRVTVTDVFRIYKAVLDGTVCYNGDVSGDTKLDITDVLTAINQMFIS